MSDKKAIIYIGLGLPIFLLLIVAIISTAAIIDILSPKEAFEALQYSTTVIITYVGGIVGYAFSPKVTSRNIDSDSDIKSKIRPIIAILIIFGLMFSLITLAILLIIDKITFDDFKRSSAIFTWTLTALASFIIGRYYGREEYQ